MCSTLLPQTGFEVHANNCPGPRTFVVCFSAVWLCVGPMYPVHRCPPSVIRCWHFPNLKGRSHATGHLQISSRSRWRDLVFNDPLIFTSFANLKHWFINPLLSSYYELEIKVPGRSLEVLRYLVCLCLANCSSLELESFALSSSAWPTSIYSPKCNVLNYFTRESMVHRVERLLEV